MMANHQNKSWFWRTLEQIHLGKFIYDCGRWMVTGWGKVMLIAAASLFSALIAFIGYRPVWQVLGVGGLAGILVFLVISLIVYLLGSRNIPLPPSSLGEPQKFEITKVEILPTPTTQINVQQVYVQVIPQCLTEAPVHECKGHLLRVYKKYLGDANWHTPVINEPLDLQWSTKDSSPLTLQPGIDQRLNVCFRDSHPTARVMPATSFVPMLWTTVPNPAGTFRFEIRVTAVDSALVDISVDVTVEGRDWDKPSVQLTQGFTSNVV